MNKDEINILVFNVSHCFRTERFSCNWINKLSDNFSSNEADWFGRISDLWRASKSISSRNCCETKTDVGTKKIFARHRGPNEPGNKSIWPMPICERPAFTTNKRITSVTKINDWSSTQPESSCSSSCNISAWWINESNDFQPIEASSPRAERLKGHKSLIGR